MRRKYLHLCYAAVALLLLNAVAAAQVGQLRGQVLFRMTNGETVPVDGAIVEAFRTDIPAKYQTKTDKKGKFYYAGLPLAGSYILAVSTDEARPDVVPNVKAGLETEYEIILEPGDGKRLTMEEARTLASGIPLGDAGAAKDRGAVETPLEILSRAFKAGNDALRAKQFDEAIKQYDEGIAAVFDQITLQTPLWVNKSVALRARGVENYNASATAQDDATRTAKIEAAKSDVSAAAEAATKALEILKLQIAPTDPGRLRIYNANKYFALAARADAMRLVVTVDPSRVDTGISAFQELIEIETDPYRKSKAQLDLARMLLDANVTDKAIEEFRKILSAEPDNMDAILGLGLALYRSGDRSRFTEAARYLQKFLASAPETHTMKQTAQETLEKLKFDR